MTLLADHTTLPAVTRMLLSADGSTTVLLEALVRARLTALVDRQGAVTPDQVPAGLPDLLAGPDDHPGALVERRSRLVTPDLEVVSTNLVVVRHRDAAELLPPADVPLGRHLARHRLSVRREALRQTVGRWPLTPDQPPCAGKEYLIHCRAGARIYVRELFNPGFVAVAPSAIPA
jgi:chorismate-pyruvate lyase